MAIVKGAPAGKPRFLVTKLAGTVNTTNLSATVTWASGDKFTAEVIGKKIMLGGVERNIVTVTSATQLVVDQIQTTASGVAYSIALY